MYENTLVEIKTSAHTLQSSMDTAAKKGIHELGDQEEFFSGGFKKKMGNIKGKRDGNIKVSLSIYLKFHKEKK